MPTPDSWRSLPDWEKARFRWLLETVHHPARDKDGNPWPFRPDQLTPEGDWLVWLVLGGRGWGKTRSGAEDVSEYARNHPGHRLAGLFATFEDGRDVAVEGESGLLSILPPSALRGGSPATAWNRSLGELIFANGARFDIYSAEKPSSLRGPQHHRAWVDELAKFRYLEAWDQLMFGLRLGPNPQCVVTTTPRPLRLLEDLISRPTTVVTKGSTFDNARNLSPAALAELRLRYEGTQLGRQELYAELLADYEGALWQRDSIRHIAATELPPLTRIAVGVDPSTWGPEAGVEHESTGRGIETGIVVVGMDKDGNCYVVEDLSCRASPAEWARASVSAYRRHRANVIVPERNVGPWVVSTIQAASEDGEPVTFARDRSGRPGVMAKTGKRARAEPVAALYEKGKVFHVGRFPELEDSMCAWDPRENWSPDRIDALVWAITWLEPWLPHAPAQTSVGQMTGIRMLR